MSVSINGNGTLTGVTGTIPSSGSTFLPAGTSAVATTVQAKLRETVSVLDFGADPTGVVPCDTALANARAYIASTNAQLVFPAGTYTYVVSPNWGINNADITTNGLVVLNYIGTGYAVNIDAGASSGVIYGMSFDGNFVVQSNALALDGVFVRSIHHSRIGLRVSGCGPTYAGVKINFSVCTEYNIVVSVNEGFVVGAKPYYGIYCGQRGAGEQTSACIFNNPIIEGVGGNGIQLASAIQNTFTGGTSEGNTGYGIAVAATSTYNTFNKLDMEVNTLGDIRDEGGSYNVYNGCYSSTTSWWISTLNATVINGTYNNIRNSGQGTSFVNVTYSNNAGTFTNVGATLTSKTNVYNNTGAIYDVNVNSRSIGPSVTTTAVASGTTVTVLTLPSTGSNFYQVLVSLPLTGSAASYSAYAVVAQDLTSSRIMSQVNGTNMVISLVGQTIQATQTSGVAAYITAVAQAI